jgi:hypothetical protein
MSAVTRTCMRTWRRLGVPRAEADAMARELEDDLGAAAADGVAEHDYIGGDAGAFARQWAIERGVTRARPRLLATGAAAVLGAVPGALAAVASAYATVSDPIAGALGGPSTAVVLLVYALGALFAYAGALAAVAALLAWRLDALTRQTLRALAIALPAAVVATLAATSAFAATQGYATDGGTIVADAAVGAACFAACPALVRWWVVKRPQRFSASL